MNAKKCDICGTFYAPYNNGRNDNEPNSLRLLREDEEFDLIAKNRYDCCPDCMNKIMVLLLCGKD